MNFKFHDVLMLLFSAMARQARYDPTDTCTSSFRYNTHGTPHGRLRLHCPYEAPA